MTIDVFNRPDLRQQSDATYAGGALSRYLNKANSTNQYVASFLVKPSGVTLFQSLRQTAHDAGFDIGYFDALEENRQAFIFFYSTAR